MTYSVLVFFFFLSLSLSLPLPLPLSPSPSLSIYLSIFLSFFLSLSIYRSLSLYLSFSFSLSLSLSLSLYLYLSLSLSLYLYLSPITHSSYSWITCIYSKLSSLQNEKRMLQRDSQEGAQAYRYLHMQYTQRQIPFLMKITKYKCTVLDDDPGYKQFFVQP